MKSIAIMFVKIGDKGVNTSYQIAQQNLSDTYQQACAIIYQLSRQEQQLLVHHLFDRLTAKNDINDFQPATYSEAWTLGQDLFGQVGSGDGTLSQQTSAKVKQKLREQHGSDLT